MDIGHFVVFKRLNRENIFFKPEFSNLLANYRYGSYEKNKNAKYL